MFTLGDAVLAIKFYLSDLYDRLKLPCQPTPLDKDVSEEDKLHTTKQRAVEMSTHAEVQAFIYNLLLMKLIDDGDLKNVSVPFASSKNHSTLANNNPFLTL